MSENWRPSGHWEGYSWCGTLPDGTRIRFTSEEEYMEYLRDHGYLRA